MLNDWSLAASEMYAGCRGVGQCLMALFIIRCSVRCGVSDGGGMMIDVGHRHLSGGEYWESAGSPSRSPCQI